MQTAKGKAEAKASQTVDKIEEAIGKLDERIACVFLGRSLLRSRNG